MTTSYFLGCSAGFLYSSRLGGGGGTSLYTGSGTSSSMVKSGLVELAEEASEVDVEVVSGLD